MTKKRVFSILKKLIVFKNNRTALASISVVILLASCSFFDGINMSKEELIKHYEKNEKAFLEVKEELEKLKDLGLRRIDDSWSDPKDLSEIGISKGYEIELKKKLLLLKCPRGVSLYGNGIAFIIYSVGIVGSGGSKGLFYSKHEPKNNYQSDFKGKIGPYEIDETIPKTSGGKYEVYIKIRNGWYIFEEYD